MGDRDGERHDIDLDRKLWDYFRLDDDIEAIYGQLGCDHAVASASRRIPDCACSVRSVGMPGVLPVLQ